MEKWRALLLDLPSVSNSNEGLQKAEKSKNRIQFNFNDSKEFKDDQKFDCSLHPDTGRKPMACHFRHQSTSMSIMRMTDSSFSLDSSNPSSTQNKHKLHQIHK